VKGFNSYDVYSNLEVFTKAVMLKIESTEVSIDDFYEDALFLTKKDDSNEILNADTIAEQLDVPLNFVVSNTIPNKIRQSDTKFYAMVNTINNSEGFMLLFLTIGDRKVTNCYSATVYEKEGFLEIGPWESVDPTEPEVEHLVIPVRRSIVNQG